MGIPFARRGGDLPLVVKETGDIALGLIAGRERARVGSDHDGVLKEVARSLLLSGKFSR